MVIVLASTATAIAIGLVLFELSARTRRSRFPRVRSVPWPSQAGLDVTPTQFWLASAGAGLATYMVVFALTSLPIVALMPALVVATLPRAYFGRKRAQRLAEVQEAWPDGLRDLI
jgi:Flp pilus assembly protein TadB